MTKDKEYCTPVEQVKGIVGPSTCASSGGAFKGMFHTNESLQSFGQVLKERKFSPQVSQKA